MNEVEINGVKLWISYEDPRYPILVLQAEGCSPAGFSISTKDWSLHRVCLCHAYSASECVCGAWDEMDDNDDT